MVVVVGIVACAACSHKPKLSPDDKAALDHYLPSARAMAEAAAPRCAGSVGLSDNSHPARGSELETDPRVLNVVVSCWRNGSIWTFLGATEFKPQPKTQYRDGDPLTFTMRRVYVAAEPREDQITTPAHQTEYIALPDGEHAIQKREVHVQRPSPDGGWIEVEIDLSL
jgi:hypothetical protein